MSDYIKRDGSIEIINSLPWTSSADQTKKKNLILLFTLYDAADVVEVVRCKDCRWYEINELKSDGTEDKRYKPSMCVLHSRSFRDNYYCADGERAEE